MEKTVQNDSEVDRLFKSFQMTTEAIRQQYPMPELADVFDLNQFEALAKTHIQQYGELNSKLYLEFYYDALRGQKSVMGLTDSTDKKQNPQKQEQFTTHFDFLEGKLLPSIPFSIDLFMDKKMLLTQTTGRIQDMWKKGIDAWKVVQTVREDYTPENIYNQISRNIKKPISKFHSIPSNPTEMKKAQSSLKENYSAGAISPIEFLKNTSSNLMNLLSQKTNEDFDDGIDLFATEENQFFEKVIEDDQHPYGDIINETETSIIYRKGLFTVEIPKDDEWEGMW